MSNLRSTIENLASQFAGSIIEALRSASMNELLDVAGGTVRRGRPRAGAGDTVSSTPSPRRGRGGRLGRRTAADIGRMIESIVDALQKSSSGLRAEQIREALGVEAKELPRPLADAIMQGRITKSGQKRATTYFAGGEGGASKRRGGRRPAKKTSRKKR